MHDNSHKKNVLAVIPARGGSKGIPSKNMVSVGGRPLLHYALQAAMHAQTIDRLVVSSDSEAILSFVGGYRPELALNRPGDLATDESTSISVLQHALAQCESYSEVTFGIVILIQCTNPFVLAADIDAVINKMMATGCDACFTVTRVNHMHPSKLKRLEGDRLLPYGVAETNMARRQELLDVYIRNGSLYALNRKTLNQGTFFGEDSRAVVIPSSRSLDINEPEDLILAEALMTVQDENRRIER